MSNASEVNANDGRQVGRQLVTWNESFHFLVRDTYSPSTIGVKLSSLTEGFLFAGGNKGHRAHHTVFEPSPTGVLETFENSTSWRLFDEQQHAVDLDIDVRLDPIAWPR